MITNAVMINTIMNIIAHIDDDHHQYRKKKVSKMPIKDNVEYGFYSLTHISMHM